MSYPIQERTSRARATTVTGTAVIEYYGDPEIFVSGGGTVRMGS